MWGLGMLASQEDNEPFRNIQIQIRLLPIFGAYAF